MIALLPLALIALWSLALLIAPTVRGERARHGIFVILRPAGPINPDGSTTAFAHVQERGEYRLHKLFGIAAGLPFLLAMPHPLLVLAQIIAMILADNLTRPISGIDYAGHGAEIMAAEAAGDLTYRAAEIARMADDGDKRGHDIPNQLARWRWLARIVFTLGRW
ncbi:hypothetical protein [Porphyrobacter sp. YT40]|uniref:hypothetical protein n=1 Tax=Porphyrobacter sp. YT40 TaxID=2547601 RepID=UPI0011440B7E|nr:hypothetical protein [Porphyrobacter sp. YT40]QDH35863.1 hypothetical protein E2E27_16985 [Porphyrobacter sp. YT40]